MKKEENGPLKFESLSDAYRAFGLPKPKHPLISLIGSANVPGEVNLPSGLHVLNFYKISYKTSLSGRLKYGQHYYDFDEGGLLFASPGQIVGGTGDDNAGTSDCSLYTPLIHPDFLWNFSLAKKIKQYGFFSLFS